VAHFVAVEQIAVQARRVQAAFHLIGDGALARTRQACGPDHCRPLVFLHRACGLVHVKVLQVDVVGAAQRKVQHASAHGVVAQAVDQDEAAGLALGFVGIEGHRPSVSSRYEMLEHPDLRVNTAGCQAGGRQVARAGLDQLTLVYNVSNDAQGMAWTG